MMIHNVFSVLNEGKKKGGKRMNSAGGTAASAPTKTMDMNINENKRWGDDSDDEIKPITVNSSQNQESVESESEEEEESDESEEEKDEKAWILPESVKAEVKAKKLSKKELKELERKELESAFADFGIPVDEKASEKPRDKVPETASALTADSGVENQDAEKKKLKKKKKKPVIANKEPTVETKTAGVTDIKSIMKGKGKKKKPEESAAVKIAREEAVKNKNKKKPRDKSAFNEFSI